MAFLDRISSKANEAVEVSKLNSIISKEKAAIDAAVVRIGGIIYSEKQNGAVFSPEVEAVFSEIDGHNAEIERATQEIERVRYEAEQARIEAERQRLEAAQARAAAAQARAAAPPPGYGAYQNTAAQSAVAHCTSCGAPLRPDAAFCMQCGAKVPPPPAQIVCTGCGRPLNENQRFCPECGTPAAAPVPAPVPAPQPEPAVSPDTGYQDAPIVSDEPQQYSADSEEN